MWKTLKIKADIKKLDCVLAFIYEELKKKKVEHKIKKQLSVIIDELYTNISRYAYYPVQGEVIIKIKVNFKRNKIFLKFIDFGVAYNPLEAMPPNTNLPLEEREIGGLGIFMVKHYASVIRYKRRGRRNILLTIVEL